MRGWYSPGKTDSNFDDHLGRNCNVTPQQGEA